MFFVGWVERFLRYPSLTLMGIAALHPSYKARYTPCLSAVATLRSEAKKPGYTALVIGWSLALAWLVSFVFYQGARALGY